MSVPQSVPIALILCLDSAACQRVPLPASNDVAGKSATHLARAPRTAALECLLHATR
jgi:hypothetical protein